MQENELPVWFLFLFPFLFAGMWLLITTIIGAVSGWNGLRDRFPDRDSVSLLKLRWQSGRMGKALGGANFGGCLTLTATSAGLRVAVWRVFGPFQSPFLVPWDRIRPEPARELFAPAVRLHFGDTGQLTIAARVWERLSAHARGGTVQPLPPVSRRRNALAYLLQWVVVAIVLGGIFLLLKHFVGDADLSPAPFVMILIILGIAQSVRFICEG